ncbi:MAG: glycerol-3-phosphate 1-O-acyltransferase PlsY [Puniceicoccales bacterium]|jgi:glycerol-3-phosphate acyltransferase PlsY|nr:glycerol-3-phosphate 1-O-acyltransferase PlsY [Puniceicoccales bacterium]
MEAIIISLAIGYFLGAIPFGFLIAKAHGICIFQTGSGSPGATNVLRILGKKAGYSVFLLDAFKGCAAVYFGILFNEPYLTLLGALLGHRFSFFTYFKGGKGVATLIGGLAFLIPIPLILGLIVWLSIFKLTHYVSLASVIFVVTLPCFNFLCNEAPVQQKHALPLMVFAVIVVWLHRANLKRLLSSKEHRF